MGDPVIGANPISPYTSIKPADKPQPKIKDIKFNLNDTVPPTPKISDPPKDTSRIRSFAQTPISNPSSFKFDKSSLDSMIEPKPQPSMLKFTNQDNNGFTMQVRKEDNPAILQIKVRATNDANKPFKYSFASPALENFAKDKILKPAEGFAKDNIVKPLEGAIGKVPSTIVLSAATLGAAIVASPILPKGDTKIKIPGTNILPGFDARAKVEYGGGDRLALTGGDISYTRSYTTGGTDLRFRASAGMSSNQGPEVGLRMDMKPKDSDKNWFFSAGVDTNKHRTGGSISFVATF